MMDKDRDLLANFRRSLYANAIDCFEKDRINQTSFQTITKFLTDSAEIDYATFRTLREISPPNGKQYFSAKVFLFLQPNLEGFIDSEDLIRYLHRSMLIERTILTLMRYSTACGSSSTSSIIINDPAYITYEQFLEFLMREYIHKVDPRWQIDTSFHEFYVCTAAMKFFYYLDPRGSNQISIRKVAHSEVYQELNSLVQTLAALKAGREFNLELEQKVEANWFNYQNALNVYHNFLMLDVDLNGLLSMIELGQFRGFSTTPTEFSSVALQRIFEELIVFAPYELDYRAFVRLVLALEDVKQALENNDQSAGNARKNVAGLKFFWNVIDYDHTNMLTPAKIHFFLTPILLEQEARNGSYGGKIPAPETIISEVYDLIGYHGDVDINAINQIGPSFEEIVASKQAELVLLMLLDYYCFDRYENRENLVHSSSGGDGDGGSEGNELHSPADEVEEQPLAAQITNNDSVNQQSSNNVGQTNNSAFRSLSKPAAKKIDFSQLKYDDEEYEDDYEF